ncbi:MAG: hypothetical protein J6Q78_03280 [Clostridia bacterium]|nr:hypothetical protein [Clostridia bacterium]
MARIYISRCEKKFLQPNEVRYDLLCAMISYILSITKVFGKALEIPASRAHSGIVSWFWLGTASTKLRLRSG